MSDPTRDLELRIVQRLREPGPGLSRNRNFHLLSEAPGGRALRLHRYLRSLERDLDAAHAAALEWVPAAEARAEGVHKIEGPGVFRLRVTVGAPPADRVAFVTVRELALLVSNPRWRALADAAGAPRGVLTAEPEAARGTGDDGAG